MGRKVKVLPLEENIDKFKELCQDATGLLELKRNIRLFIGLNETTDSIKYIIKKHNISTPKMQHGGVRINKNYVDNNERQFCFDSKGS